MKAIHCVYCPPDLMVAASSVGPAVNRFIDRFSSRRETTTKGESLHLDE